MVLKHTVLRSRRFERARPHAGPRGARIQPGHIEFGTGGWSLSVCFDGYRLEELTDLHLAPHP
jgi:hypothetical protein